MFRQRYKSNQKQDGNQYVLLRIFISKSMHLDNSVANITIVFEENSMPHFSIKRVYLL